MTKEEVKERFKELMRANQPLNEMERLLNKALDSGALDYENDRENDYRLAKIIYHAILCTMAEQWELSDKKNRNASANLQKFL